MNSSVIVDDSLINEAQIISKINSKTELMEIALKEFIENQKRKKMLELKGKIEFFDNYDYKNMRVVN
jgi:Holliday junction resolvase RusA-like endonuclease